MAQLLIMAIRKHTYPEYQVCVRKCLSLLIMAIRDILGKYARRYRQAPASCVGYGFQMRTFKRVNQSAPSSNVGQ
jgi:hypothetical protein